MNLECKANRSATVHSAFQHELVILPVGEICRYLLMVVLLRNPEEILSYRLVLLSRTIFFNCFEDIFVTRMTTEPTMSGQIHTKL